MTTPGPLRVGDAERDTAASALSEHYASGRLTKVEYDERLEAIWAARYDSDLRSLFSDLPGPHGAVDARRNAERVASPRTPESRWGGFTRGAPMFV
ncbi:DUF1707 SHOCT-like domain-containing protein, partial [Phytoactinopolyspora endophytica]|uniref:DUF1707 SHOCT-like domain-containing protein n=1 Tax=Phytoactinopolyspora endophytica TaxID=1642495 RepID=UPI0013EB673F